MKKLSAILLISIFAFSQYARQLSYLECKFSNTFKDSSAKCDCEKQAGFDKQDTSQSPVPKIHTHNHPDEFFSSVRVVYINPYPGNIHTKLNRFLDENECAGYDTKPWQPPNT